MFHKSCYTSRSTGYKYRTLSTNTGERKRRDSKEDSTFDRKFKELKREITTRIDDEVSMTQEARERIKTKYEKINAKIDSMLEFQNILTCLRKDLRAAESTLADMFVRVEKLKLLTSCSSEVVCPPAKSCFRLQFPIADDIDLDDSITTHA